MTARRTHLPVLFLVLTLLGCDRPDAAGVGAPSFTVGGVGRPSVLVNPNANDQGTAKTIQEGIDMVGEGGTVLVLPGTYAEAIVIGKGLTLQSVEGESGPVVVEPPGAPTTAVAITTRAPVVIRGLTVHATGVNGIRGAGVVDVTVERVSVTAVSPPFGVDRLISVANDPNPTGARARLTVRESFMDGTIACTTWPAACTFDAAATFPQVFGIIAGGDVDARLERNVIRRAGGACIFVVVRNDLGGETNADILDNDLDECHPLGRAGAIFVAPAGATNPSATLPVRVTGTVNTVGNTVANTSGSCLTSTAISYVVLGGRIERNRIAGVVQACAFPTARARPGASGCRAGLRVPDRARSSRGDLAGKSAAVLPASRRPGAVQRHRWGRPGRAPRGVEHDDARRRELQLVGCGERTVRRGNGHGGRDRRGAGCRDTRLRAVRDGAHRGVAGDGLLSERSHETRGTHASQRIERLVVGGGPRVGACGLRL